MSTHVSMLERANRAREYLEVGYAACNHAVPSLAGLAGYMGVGRNTVRAWAESDQDFGEMVECISAVQECMLINGGLNRSFDASVAKLLLGKHGYSAQATIEHAGMIKNESAFDASGLSDSALDELVAIRAKTAV